MGPQGTVEIRGRVQTALLALLAAQRGSAVSRYRITEELWPGGDISPATLRVNVRRLRDRFLAVTGSDPIVNTPTGYLLVLPDEAADDARFSSLLARASSALERSEFSCAVDLATAALRQWDGPPFDGAQDIPAVQPIVTRLEGLRKDTSEILAAALIECGEHGEAVTELKELCAAEPYRESAWGLQALGLYRLGRQREALNALDEFRRMLNEEAGLDPGFDLHALDQAILAREDPRTLSFGLVGPQGGAKAIGPQQPAAHGSNRAELDQTPRRPFVGRSTELEKIAALWRSPGGSSAAVVEGGMGIGKTCLGRVVAEAAAADGVVPVLLTCQRDASEATTPAHDLLRALLQHAPTVTPLDQVLLSTMVPDVEPGVGTAVDPGGAPDTTHRSIGLDTAAERLLVTLTEPPLLILDDAQWLCESSAQLFAHLAATAPLVPWLVLARSADQSPGCVRLLALLARRHASWQELAPLTEAETTELVHLTVSAPAPPSWAGSVVESACGNPFLAIELTRHIQHTGEPDTMPRGIQAVVGAELGALGAAAAMLAEVVALAGTPLPAEILLEAAGLDGSGSESAIEALVDAHLIDADVDRRHLWSGHDLIRSAITGLIEGPRRRRRHLALATALEGWPYDGARLRHLLRAIPLADPATIDKVALSVFRNLRWQFATAELTELGGEYLAATDTALPTRAGLEVRLIIASAQHTSGSVDAACAAFDSLRSQLDLPTNRRSRPMCSWYEARARSRALRPERPSPKERPRSPDSPPGGTDAG